MIYKGYRVSFHNKKGEKAAWENTQGEQRSIERTYLIVLHLPWGCVAVGTVRYQWNTAFGRRSMPWTACNVEGRHNRWPKWSYDHVTRERCVAALLDEAYPDLPEAAA